MSPRLALASSIALGYAVAALGATTDAAPKREAHQQKPPLSVTLENKRSVALQSFEIIMTGKGLSTGIVIGKLDKPLLAGESVSMKLEKPKGCLFEARWKFEDADDAGAVDLCSDAHIVLVD